MKLHTVFVTYNRLELTKQAIESYMETVGVPHSALVVDNASTDGTMEWLIAECPIRWFSCGRNHYPGRATNWGWEDAPADAEFLQRADNDFAFLPGWLNEVERCFSDPHVGQVGLRTDAEELHCPTNVGGNCVIRRELWDKGLRYDERPWPEYEPGFSEDSYFSPAVEAMGYRWTRVERPCIVSLASGDWADPYYAKSYGDRRIPETPSSL